MGWYAKELIFNASEAAWKAIESNAPVRMHLFVLEGEIGHDWDQPQDRHRLPDDGLFFIRPICSRQHDHAFHWFKKQVLDPKDLEPANSVEFENDINLIEASHPVGPGALREELPTLRFAKALSQQIRSTVVFYDAHCFGGEMEVEMAWLFGEDEQTFLYNPKNNKYGTVLKITPDASVTMRADIVREMLMTLGCDQPTPYFAPHTRGFKWSQFQVR